MDYIENLRDRFRVKYRVDQETGCWNWIGATSKGYGRIQHCGKVYPAHRISLLLAGYQLDDELVVDHLCENTRCVNPEHLKQTTSYFNTMRGHSPEFFEGRFKCGHEIVEGNVYKSRGSLVCRQCTKKKALGRYYRKRYGHPDT